MMAPELRADIIYQQLQAAFNPLQLSVEDESHFHVGHVGHKGAGHFAVKIVSECFSGKTLIARHRMVYAALESLIGSDIHALKINAKTPEEIGAFK